MWVERFAGPLTTAAPHTRAQGFAYLAYEDQRSTVVAVDNLNGSKVLGWVASPGESSLANDTMTPIRPSLLQTNHDTGLAARCGLRRRVLKVDHVGDYRVKKEEQETEQAAAAAAKRPAADNGGGGVESSGGRTLQPWESGGSLFSMLTSDDAAGADGKRKAPRAGAAAHFGDDDPAAKKVRLF